MREHASNRSYCGVPSEDLLIQEQIPLPRSTEAHGRGLTLRSAMAAILAAGGPSTAPLELPSVLLRDIGVDVIIYPREEGLLAFIDQTGAALTATVSGRGIGAVDQARPGFAYVWLTSGDALQLTTSRGASLVFGRDEQGLTVGLVRADRPSTPGVGVFHVDGATLRRMAAECESAELSDLLEQAANDGTPWQVLSALAEALFAPVSSVARDAERLLTALSPEARELARRAARRFETMLAIRVDQERSAAADDGIRRSTLIEEARQDRKRLRRLRQYLGRTQARHD